MQESVSFRPPSRRCHGVGQGYRHDEWFDALNASLEAHGTPALGRTSKRLVAPDYVDLLKAYTTRSPSVDEPKVTKHRLSREGTRELAWEYARNQAEALRGLTHTVDASGLAGSVGRFQAVDINKVPLEGT